MKRLAWAVLVLVLAPSATADYLMPAYDAAHTGNSPDDAPEWGDVAFRLKLPGLPADFGHLVIVDDEAFVLLQNPADGAEPGIWVIDLEEGTARVLVPLDLSQKDVAVGATLLSDGERLLVARTGVFETYTFDGAGPLHRAELPPVIPADERSWACTLGASTAEAFHIPCLEIAYQGEQIVGTVTFVATLETADLSVRHVWYLDPSTHAAQQRRDPLPPTRAPSPCDHERVAGQCAGTPAEAIVGVSVGGGLLYATAFQASGGVLASAADPPAPFNTVTATDARLFAIDVETGETEWGRRFPLDDSGVQDRPLFAVASILPVFHEGRLYVTYGDLFILNAADGNDVARVDLRDRDAEQAQYGQGLAFDGERLFATSLQTLHVLDEDGKKEASSSLENPDATFTVSPLVLAGGNVYGLVDVGRVVNTTGLAPQSHPRAIQAWDSESLTPLWTVSEVDEELLTAISHFGLADGRLVMLTEDGHIVAIGDSAVSLRVEAGLSTAYPPIGETVRVDLSASVPGRDGAPTQFRAHWSDGTVTDWQGSPVLEHAYEEARVYEARFEIANDAGQTASAVQAFDVGGTPPQELNFLQKAFQPKNYDLTFGVLGILLALSGGTIAVTNRRLRHGRLQGEGHEERQLAYRRVLIREIEHGAAPEEIAQRLKPLRGVLGIADRDHARLEAEARALRVAVAGGARLLVPGERFLERYEVERQLGAGGAGLTYLCRDVRLGRRVVLKVLRTAGDEATAAALEEARAYAAVDHDRVVTLLDVEQLGDDVYLVLEYVDGASLAEHLADGPLQPEAMHRLAEDLLSALEAVHGAGLVHRDVKPANVLVTQGGVCKLGDFGLASAALDDETAVGFDGGAGTARYMAPEQARGERVDARSDLYAAALTFYEAWTGTPYYERRAKESLVDVQMRAAHGNGSLEGVPEGSTLRAFFDRALSLDPAGRFQDAAAMRAVILEALEGTEGTRRKKGTRPTRPGDDA